jgi:hypothetical protein
MTPLNGFLIELSSRPRQGSCGRETLSGTASFGRHPLGAKPGKKVETPNAPLSLLFAAVGVILGLGTIIIILAESG